jgi:chromosome partitioning protein
VGIRSDNDSNPDAPVFRKPVNWITSTAENSCGSFQKTSKPAKRYTGVPKTFGEGIVVAVIAVIQQKGGVGKSTITANVAGELLRRGRSVKVLDLDPQESLVTWAQLGAGLLNGIVEGVATHNPRDFKATLERARKSAERVILDCPPGLPDTGLMAALVADLALLPVTPSPLDVIASKKALQLMRDAQTARKNGRPVIGFLPSRVAQNRVHESSTALTSVPAIGKLWRDGL